MFKYIGILLGFIIIINCTTHGQDTDAVIFGDVQCLESDGCHIPFASIQILNTSIGTAADATGHFMLTNLPVGRHLVKASAVGYKSSTTEVTVHANESVEIKFKLEMDMVNLDGVVVTANRKETDRMEAPVIVGVIDDRIFNATQSVSLAEGLNFQPGLRLENNCQNCGFTQVRMNGLGGPYSQILVNSRPIFSALQGVYGLEQIPANMVDRVEVVRGGGSALYGGNAIAGTINIITREPENNTYQIGSSHALIDGKSAEHAINGTLALVSDDLKTGASLYGNYRGTDEFDANKDGYSELSRISNTTFGGSVYFRPGSLSKVKADFHSINEFRRGGNLFSQPPHNADIAEQLDHKIIGGGLTYEGYSRSHSNKYALYSSLQNTSRSSYYGLGGNPGNEELYEGLLQEERTNLAAQAANYYGFTDDLIWVSGFQFSRDMTLGSLTAGVEHQYNDVNDQMPGYNRYIIQKTRNTGVYGQYEIKYFTGFTFLTGLRYDHAFIDGSYILYDDNNLSRKNFNSLNPRINVLYTIKKNIQARVGYARGFRAPQAFDEDLHINTVGGETQFITFANDLIQETSNAWTASLDFSGKAGKGQYGLLLESFYTVLYNSFINVGIFEGDNQSTPSIFEKRNAEENGVVAGLNVEYRYAPDNTMIFQIGGTGQQANFSEPIAYYTEEGDNGNSIEDDRILRSPAFYGYFVATWKPVKHFELDLSGNYTGTMAVAYESGLQRPVGIYDTPDFFTINIKANYDFHITEEFTLLLFGGINNIFNSYQDDFDTGIFRDAGYIYGPVRPRVFFAGVKIGNFL